jgi:hypothetical protein
MMEHGLGSVSSDVRDGGDAGLGPPVSGVSPHRPLLLRSDVPWTPEGGARGPGAGAASAGSGSGLTVSPSSRPLPIWSGLLAGVADAAEEEREYVVPQGVMDRLAVQESLSAAAHRRRKRKMDEAAELDDASDDMGGTRNSRRDDDPDGGGRGAVGEGCPLA